MKNTLITNKAATAAIAPISASTSPSMRNGTRMRQFVAPTSRMMPISLRRANMPMRSVFATSAIAEASMITAIDSTPIESTRVIAVSRSSRSR